MGGMSQWAQSVRTKVMEQRREQMWSYGSFESEDYARVNMREGRGYWCIRTAIRFQIQGTGT